MCAATHTQNFCSTKTLQHTRLAKVDSAPRAQHNQQASHYSHVRCFSRLGQSHGKHYFNTAICCGDFASHMSINVNRREVFLALSAATGNSPRSELWSGSSTRNSPAKRSYPHEPCKSAATTGNSQSVVQQAAQDVPRPCEKRICCKHEDPKRPHGHAPITRFATIRDSRHHTSASGSAVLGLNSHRMAQKPS